MMRKYLMTVALVLMLVSAGWAQTSASDVEKELDHERSGVITLQQLTEDLQFLVTPFDEAVIHFVLPRGWELVEETIDPVTGKQRENINVYVLLSRAPVFEPDEPTDLIFELDIYQKGLLDDLPPDTPQEERNVGVQLWKFLNEQVSINLRAGLDLKSSLRNLEPKPYGSGSEREPEFFVPIFYETPSGAMLYTFTSFTGETVWMVKFLVAEDQTENYGALIALIMDNTFGLEREVYDALQNQQDN